MGCRNAVTIRQPKFVWPFLFCNGQPGLHACFVVTLDIAEEKVTARRQLCFQLPITTRLEVGNLSEALQLFFINAMFGGVERNFLVGRLELHEDHFVLFAHRIVVHMENRIAGLDGGLVKHERHRPAAFTTLCHFDCRGCESGH
ncbi:hypothetical protein AT6N2_C0822 [Agrobacterium tumefaciens]|nr:hypothetical protein AT6N2_C0822 [Agrobacterium tumefaciens]